MQALCLADFSLHKIWKGIHFSFPILQNNAILCAGLRHKIPTKHIFAYGDNVTKRETVHGVRKQIKRVTTTHCILRQKES